MIRDWIDPENAIAFAETMCLFTRGRFEEVDVDAIELGVKQTDSDKNQWFEYRSVGPAGTIQYAFADEIGGSAMNVKVDAPEEFHDYVRAAILIFQHFNISPDSRLG